MGESTTAWRRRRRTSARYSPCSAEPGAHGGPRALAAHTSLFDTRLFDAAGGQHMVNHRVHLRFFGERRKDIRFQSTNRRATFAGAVVVGETNGHPAACNRLGRDALIDAAIQLVMPPQLGGVRGITAPPRLHAKSIGSR